MNAEAIEALDDPALTLPRVLDVEGTFRRLGFQLCKGRGLLFYRQFVLLARAVAPPTTMAKTRRRQISHVELNITGSRIYAAYGYPERYKKKLKLIEHFVRLSDHTVSENVDFNGRDDRLRKFEKMIGELVTCLKTKTLDNVVERDSDTGLVKVTIPDHEALHQTVGHYLHINIAHEKSDWWSDESEPKSDGYYPIVNTRTGRVSSREPNLSRLPNFTRSIRRGIRRPI